MRVLRREAATDEGSQRICDALVEVVAELETGIVMVFEPVAGEPDLRRFVDWCDAQGIVTVAPVAEPSAAHPVDPSGVDVVVVPGLAFTPTGSRLGQGGGWYDAFLADTRPACRTIGVCFEVQVVGDLPVEPHDVRLDQVVTDQRIIDVVMS